MLKLPIVYVSATAFFLTGCSDAVVLTDKNPCWTEKPGDFDVKGNVILYIQKYGSVRILNKNCEGRSVGVKLSEKDGIISDDLYKKYGNEKAFWIEVGAYVKGKKTGDRDKGDLTVEIEDLRIGTNAPTVHMLKPEKSSD